MHHVPASASPSPEPAPSAQELERNKQVIRTLYEECLGRGRIELLPELIAEDFPGIRGGRGPDAFRAVVDGLRTGFPDIQYTIEDLIAERDRVVIRWTWQGTHNGQYLVFPPTGQPHRVGGITIYRLSDGKVTEAWLQTDRLGHLQQLGAVPADIAGRTPRRDE